MELGLSESARRLGTRMNSEISYQKLVMTINSKANMVLDR